MSWELNRATFRRLVQAYIVTGICCVGLAMYELFGPGWRAFSDDFDALVVRHFGDHVPPDWLMWILLTIFAVGTLWMVASMAGLLFFKRWARIGSWASVLTILGIYILIARMEPSYSTPLYDVLAAIDSALLGAIVVLAYARGLGADWFARAAD